MLKIFGHFRHLENLGLQGKIILRKSAQEYNRRPYDVVVVSMGLWETPNHCRTESRGKGGFVGDVDAA